jgi:hypothetical protein
VIEYTSGQDVAQLHLQYCLVRAREGLATACRALPSCLCAAFRALTPPRLTESERPSESTPTSTVARPGCTSTPPPPPPPPSTPTPTPARRPPAVTGVLPHGRAHAPTRHRPAHHREPFTHAAMDGFDTITMSWAHPAVPMQTVTGPEGHMSMPIVPMDPYDQRSTFDAETYAG